MGGVGDGAQDLTRRDESLSMLHQDQQHVDLAPRQDNLSSPPLDRAPLAMDDELAYAASRGARAVAVSAGGVVPRKQLPWLRPAEDIIDAGTEEGSNDAA